MAERADSQLGPQTERDFLFPGSGFRVTPISNNSGRKTQHPDCVSV